MGGCPWDLLYQSYARELTAVHLEYVTDENKCNKEGDLHVKAGKEVFARIVTKVSNDARNWKISDEKRLQKRKREREFKAFAIKYKLSKIFKHIFGCSWMGIIFFLIIIPLVMDGKLRWPRAIVYSPLLIAFGLPFLAGLPLVFLLYKMTGYDRRLWHLWVIISGSFLLTTIFLTTKYVSDFQIPNIMIVFPLVIPFVFEIVWFGRSFYGNLKDMRTLVYVVLGSGFISLIPIFLVNVALEADYGIGNRKTAFIPLWIAIIIFAYAVRYGFCFFITPLIFVVLVYDKYASDSSAPWTPIFTLLWISICCFCCTALMAREKIY